MLEKVIPLIATLAAPVLGLLVRASRRNRLRNQIRGYAQLSEELERQDGDSAALVRDLMAETVPIFVAAERAALHRRLDPGAVFAVLLFIAPGVAAVGWVWTRDEWWKWPIIAISVLWVGVVIAATWGQLWKSPEHTNEAR
jgi:hypothetical protein